MKIPSYLKKVREPINNKKLTKKYLTLFEDKVKNIYESSMINAPIHLSKGNEDELIDLALKKGFIYKNEDGFYNYK